MVIICLIVGYAIWNAAVLEVLMSNEAKLGLFARLLSEGTMIIGGHHSPAKDLRFSQINTCIFCRFCGLCKQ